MLHKPVRLKMFAIGTLTALAAWPVAEAQFGGGGFGGGGVGGGFGGGGVAPQYLPEGAVASRDVIVVVHKSLETVSGYCDAAGEWDHVSIEPHPKLGITPIVSSGVAVVPGRRHLHAYGAETGKWASLEVGEGVDTSTVAVAASRATFLTKTHFHVFSSASGKWASVDLTED